jgi:hypothetical protein
VNNDEIQAGLVVGFDISKRISLGLNLFGLGPSQVGSLVVVGVAGRVDARASDPALSHRPELSVTIRASVGPAMVMAPRWCNRW